MCEKRKEKKRKEKKRKEKKRKKIILEIHLNLRYKNIYKKRKGYRSIIKEKKTKGLYQKLLCFYLSGPDVAQTLP